MKAFFVGATGFIGPHIVRAFLDAGFEVWVLLRSQGKGRFLPEGARFVEGDPRFPGKWQSICSEADIVVNLAGESIFGLWTASKRKRIRESRLASTRRVVEALKSDAFLINASAVGYYGMDRGEELLTEESPPGEDFLAEVCVDWEREALRAKEKGCRVLVLRLGVVLGRGGALERMLWAYRVGLGAVVGSGRQWFPWVHIDDVVSAVFFALDAGIDGPINLVSPHPVRQKDFARSLASILGRPCFLRIPASALKVILGEASGLLLGSLRVVPKRLEEAGFSFKYAHLGAALSSLLR